MFISRREYYVEVHAILQEGVDFTEEDLVPNALVGGKLKELSSSARSSLAFKNGFLSTEWSGHYHPESKTVECTFRKPLFLNEESNTVIVK